MTRVLAAALAAVFLVAAVPAPALPFARMPPPTSLGETYRYRVESTARTNNREVSQTRLLDITVLAADGDNYTVRVVGRTVSRTPALTAGGSALSAAMDGLEVDLQVKANGAVRLLDSPAVRRALLMRLRAMPAAPEITETIRTVQDFDERLLGTLFVADLAPLTSMQNWPAMSTRVDEVRDAADDIDLEGRRIVRFREVLSLEPVACLIRVRRYTGTDPNSPDPIYMKLAIAADVSLGDGWVVRARVTEDDQFDDFQVHRVQVFTRLDPAPCPI